MITNELLKNGGDGIVTSLKKLFNQLLHLGNTPLEWNKGIIVPIFKKGNKNDLNNYRGITLTSCVSKIFNRIVANSISNFVENNNILSEVQEALERITGVKITCLLSKVLLLQDSLRISKLIWPFWTSERLSTQCGETVF